MFTNCYNSGPFDFALFVGNVETYFTHAIHVRERVSPIVNLFNRSVPIVIKLWSEVRGAFVPFMCFIKVAAYVTICH